VFSVQQNVARFEVTVNHATSVQIGYRLYECSKEEMNFVKRQRATLQARTQRPTFNIWCYQKEASLLFAKFNQGQDMLMLDISADFSLAQESLAGGDIMYQVGANNLHSNLPPKSSSLPRQVHLAHAPYIDTTHQVVIAKLLYLQPSGYRALLLFY